MLQTRSLSLQKAQAEVREARLALTFARQFSVMAFRYYTEFSLEDPRLNFPDLPQPVFDNFFQIYESMRAISESASNVEQLASDRYEAARQHLNEILYSN